MKEEVLNFISNFSGAEDVFLYGCCYWFAFILSARFGGKIYYDQVDNHFVVEIDGKYYDASGELDVSNRDLIKWELYEAYDPFDYERVVRYCINKQN